MNVRIVIPLALLSSIAAALAGCTETIEPEEQRQLARAYSELLIQQHLHPGDSTAAARALDSAAKAHGYATPAELRSAMEKLARHPNEMRSVLDMVQTRLQQIQQGLPDTTLGR